MQIQDFAVPEADRGAFVQFMALVARADGALADEELQALQSAMAAWALTDEQQQAVEDVVRNGADVQELGARLSHPKTPYLLIQELVTLAVLDGSYDDAERIAVASIAAAVGVSPERVAAIEAWVADGLAWRQRGVELLSPEGA